MIRICLIGDPTEYLMQMDEQSLKNHFEILPVYVSSKNYLELLKSSLTTMKRAIRDSDMVLIHGADVHAVMAMRIAFKHNKKVVVAVHGYEVCKNPEMKYGLQIQKFRGNMARWALRHADAIITYTYAYWGKIENITKKPVHKLEVFVDPYKSEDQIVNLTKEDIVVTVADATVDTYRVSGIQMFNMLALQHPEYVFYVIGKTDPTIKKMYDRVKYLGELKRDNTIDWIAKARYYCQFSYQDNVNPYAIMAVEHQCAVVYTNCDGLHDYIGLEGFACRFMDVYDASRELNLAASTWDEYQEKRKRAASRFINGYSNIAYANKARDVLMKIHDEG
jgi:glycosyltransferase involved in cell wall biosynthesis